MLTIDSLCFNQDRHSGNYGVLFDNDTLQIIGMSPVFDLNMSMLPYVEMSDFKNIGDKLYEYAPKLGNDFTRIGQIAMNDVIRERLKDIADFSFSFRGDDNFPEEYLTFSRDDHFMQYLFDFKKTEEVTNALVDYFYNYTTQNVLSMDVELKARLELFERVYNIVGAAADVVGFMKSFQDCAATIGTMGYSEPAIRASITRANNVQDRARASEIALTGARKYDLDAINNWMRNKNANVYNFSQIGSDGKLCESESAIEDAQDVVDDADEFIKGLTETDWSSINFDSVVDSAAESAKLLSIASTTVNYGAKIIKAITTKGKLVKDWPIKIRSSAMRAEVVKSGTKAGEMSNLKFSIITDAIDTAKDMLEVAVTYSKIKVNYSEYGKYLDLLKYIEENGKTDYIRNGARNITKLFTETGDVDWKKFNSQVLLAENKKLDIGALKITVDILSYAFPVVSLLNTTYKAAKLAFTIAGVTQRAKTIVEAQVYYHVAHGSIVKLGELITYANGLFELKDNNTDPADVNKYIIQLAQSRITGLNTVMEYITHGSLAGVIDRLFFNRSKEDIEEDHKGMIGEVYEVAKKCKVKLSESLPFYNDYSH